MSHKMKKWMLGVALVVPVTLLAACSGRPTQALVRVMEPIFPTVESDEVYRHSCEMIWKSSNTDSAQSVAYWLRASECVDDITSQSRAAFVQGLSTTTWQGKLTRTLVELHDKPSLQQRRRALNSLSALRQQVPASVLPLIRLWREQQVMLIAATNDRLRAKEQVKEQVKQLEDEVEALHTERQVLQRRLADAEHKLRRLMDIERQFSARKLSPTKQVLSIQDNSASSFESVVPAAADLLPSPVVTDPVVPDKPNTITPEPIKEPQVDETKKDSEPAAG